MQVCKQQTNKKFATINIGLIQLKKRYNIIKIQNLDSTKITNKKPNNQKLSLFCIFLDVCAKRQHHSAIELKRKIVNQINKIT